MATKDEVITETDDIDVVEVDALPGEEAKAAEAAAKEVDDKAKAEDPDTEDDEHEDESEQEDSRLAEHDESDEDGKERKKRLNRRARQKELRDRDRQEIAQLRQEIASLRTGQQELRVNQTSISAAGVEARLAEVKRDIATADSLLAQAIKEADGDTYATAMRLRDEAKDLERELTEAVKTLKAQPTQDGPDPQVRTYADQWRQANSSWYGRDENATAVVNVIDAGVMRDGYDPKSREYWAELTRRTQAHFAAGQSNGKDRQKENGVDKDTTRRRAPPLGDNRDGNGQGGRRQVYLSKERVDAIKQAGAWDDPKERAALIKAYEEYDRENPASR